MKRVRCPKCDQFVLFDETQYADGQTLVFVCANCQKEFKIRLGVSRLRATQREENRATAPDASPAAADGGKETADWGYITVVENTFAYRQQLPLQEGDNLITAVSTARAGYKANGGAWALCLGPGRYTESTVVQLDFPLVFEGGFDNPTIVNSNVSIERMCWHNLKDARSAFRRLTLESLTREKWTSNPKLSGLVSVAAGMLEGVTVTNAFSGTNYDSGKGAVWVSGTGVVTNCLITHCRGMCASTGKDTLGAVNLAGGLIASTRITHCSSEGTSNGVGGGIYMTAGTVRNCLIDNCTAFKEGSGLYITPSAACVVENCTIADCGACVEQGSSAGTYGVYMTGSSAAKSCTFVNNIVYGNSGASSTQKDTMNLNRVNTTYTYLRNNVFDVQVPDSSTASGNIAGNPAFTDRANGDYTTGKGAGTDKGEDLAWAHDAYMKDLAGNPRILGEGLDVGCYEYVPSDKLDVTVNVILPEEVKVGAVATFSAEASGGAGDYVYAWFVDDVQIVSGAEYATYDYTIAAAGAHSVKCVVTDGDGTSVEKEEKDILRVYIRHGYVSKTGSNTSPYDTPETAADNFDAVFAILDPGAADEVTVGPGEYEVTNVIMLAQKTYLHSTDGAAKTFRYLAVSNCVATGEPITAYDSVDLGGNTGWTFLSTPKPGAKLTWTGAVSEDPSDHANWSPARERLETDDVTIPAGATVSLANLVTPVHSLTFSGSGIA